MSLTSLLLLTNQRLFLRVYSGGNDNIFSSRNH